MKHILRFLSVYIVTIIAISSFYYHTDKEYKNTLELTEYKLTGVVYIQMLFHLGIGLVELDNLTHHNKIVQKNALKKDINNDIKALLDLQQLNTKFKDEAFNNDLKSFVKEDKKSEHMHDFLELLNHENYRIGDNAHLLFEEDREVYFLASLTTHYMPEYLFSLLLVDDVVHELHHNFQLSDYKKRLLIPNYAIEIL